MAMCGFSLFKASARAVCKLMVQYEFRSMSADFEKTGNQVQLELLMARLLNVRTAVFEILTFAMSELRSHVQWMVHQLLLSGLMSTSIHMTLRRASVQNKPSILLGYIKSEACKFYRKYLLPCRHIFHCDTEVKVLTAV